ncbi:MAG: NTP transferase domain-containing protein [Muribaculaceae bacterium]|nr:NTP transferase domain-containing protein [Muribaculaceae bacterium]
MRAIIFAAGIGSRLKPFTDHHPKALAPVNGRPIIGHLMDKILKAGITSVVVNLHHFPEQIKEYFRANDNFGIDVEFSDESRLLLDTGGALANIGRHSRTFAHPGKAPILVHNADILTDFSISEMEKAHTLAGADATILVDPQRHSSRKFLFAEDRRLKGWRNLSSGKILPESLDTDGLHEAAFGGVHIISPDFLQKIADDASHPLQPFSIVDYYVSQAPKLNIKGFAPDTPYRWFDIGTTEKLAEAEKAW